MKIDWDAAALAAQRAHAAYQADAAQSKRAFTALGDTWIDLFQGENYQAVLSTDAQGAAHLSISGTRTDDDLLFDLFDDIDLTPTPVAGGSVTAGVLREQSRLWFWVLNTIDSQQAPLNVAGHSIGATRTHLVPLFLPPERIGALHSFEAPKFCDARYYATYATSLAQMLCTLNGQDSLAAFPWLGDRWQARPEQDHVWLLTQGFKIIPAAQWPGGDSFKDHSITMIIQRLQAIAASFRTHS